MILVDYSQVALAAILTFQRELKGTESEVKNLIRHVTLSTLKSYKKKYGKEFGELVICCDGRKYWRKEVFEHYKASRKKNRDASDLDWKLIFDTLSEMREDIAKNFPYRVIHVERAEADDVIAVMTEWCQSNAFIQEGLMEEPQKVLILSSDKDFKQLQLAPFSSGNVRQWSPMQKKYIQASKQEIIDFTVEHIVKGDTGDGIPNILSKDDVFACFKQWASHKSLPYGTELAFKRRFLAATQEHCIEVALDRSNGQRTHVYRGVKLNEKAQKYIDNNVVFDNDIFG